MALERSRSLMTLTEFHVLSSASSNIFGRSGRWRRRVEELTGNSTDLRCVGWPRPWQVAGVTCSSTFHPPGAAAKRDRKPILPPPRCAEYIRRAKAYSCLLTHRNSQWCTASMRRTKCSHPIALGQIRIQSRRCGQPKLRTSWRRSTAAGADMRRSNPAARCRGIAVQDR